MTRYPDDPDQLNVVGYELGNVNPDEYIVIGGHFDIAYAFTPPSGTGKGANDDTSGSAVSLEMGQALAQMEFDHTVVQALWACESLAGLLAYVANLPENGARSRLHELRHGGPQLPGYALTEPIVDLTGIFQPTSTIGRRHHGCNQANMERMMDMVATIEDDLAYTPPPKESNLLANRQSARPLFFFNGYPTFNFFGPVATSASGKWHSPLTPWSS